jgi:hypothetical protein
LKLCCILGFLRLPKVFMLCVLRADKVARIGGRWIYGIGDWKLKAVASKHYDKTKSTVGQKYKQIIMQNIELTKDFYFSYFYDITHTLQHNLLEWKNKSASSSTSSSPLDSTHTPPMQTTAFPLSNIDSNTHTHSPFPDMTSTDPIHTMPLNIPIDVLDDNKQSYDSFSPSSTYHMMDTQMREQGQQQKTTQTSGNSTATPSTGSTSSFSSPPPVSPLPPPPSPHSPRSTCYTYNEKFLWNLHLAREFLHCVPHGSYWLVPLIHGFCQQAGQYNNNNTQQSHMTITHSQLI